MSKILLYDIETTPNLAWVWGKYEQNVIAYKSQWEMLCFAYKWLDETAVHVSTVRKLGEKGVVSLLRELFDEADIVIAHNGDNFDQRMANAKFIEFGLDPPSPYKSVDTKKVAKRYFRFNSNKLDDLGELLHLGRKTDTGGFDLWLGCMRGDSKSWQLMKDYNKQDVLLLEKVYLKLRPWVDNHPAMNVIDGRPEACPKCGGTRLQSRGTRKTTKVNTYRRYQCMGCGGWCSSRTPEHANVLYTN